MSRHAVALIWAAVAIASTVYSVSQIGKERKPLTARQAAISVALTVPLLYGLWWLSS